MTQSSTMLLGTISRTPYRTSSVQSPLFGQSKGTKSVLRIAFDGFENSSHWVACARKVNCFNRWFRYTCCKIQLNGKTETVWLNTNSLKKRFSGSHRDLKFLQNFFPEDKKIQNRIVELEKQKDAVSKEQKETL